VLLTANIIDEEKCLLQRKTPANLAGVYY